MKKKKGEFEQIVVRNVSEEGINNVKMLEKGIK